MTSALKAFHNMESGTKLDLGMKGIVGALGSSAADKGRKPPVPAMRFVQKQKRLLKHRSSAASDPDVAPQPSTKASCAADIYSLYGVAAPMDNRSQELLSTPSSPMSVCLSGQDETGCSSSVLEVDKLRVSDYDFEATPVGLQNKLQFGNPANRPPKNTLI
jgi:hypothetical protein